MGCSQDGLPTSVPLSTSAPSLGTAPVGTIRIHKPQRLHQSGRGHLGRYRARLPGRFSSAVRAGRLLHIGQVSLGPRNGVIPGISKMWNRTQAICRGRPGGPGHKMFRSVSSSLSASPPDDQSHDDDRYQNDDTDQNQHQRHGTGFTLEHRDIREIMDVSRDRSVLHRG